MQTLYLVAFALILIGILAKKPMMFGAGCVLALLFGLNATGLPTKENLANTQISATANPKGDIIITDRDGKSIRIPPPMFTSPQK